MAQRRHHYEVAFEDYLRRARIPYVAVDEARKALLPEHAPVRYHVPQRLKGAEPNAGASAEGASAEGAGGVAVAGSPPSLKSFDFVIYGEGTNLLVEVKGRRIARRARAVKSSGRARGEGTGALFGASSRVTSRKLETWVTLDDVRSLSSWQSLFGTGFEAAFLFVYWCDEQPPDGLFQEVFEHRGRWYALRAVLVDLYRQSMKIRSPRWGTMHVSPGVFERISQPFAPDWSQRLYAGHGHNPYSPPPEPPAFEPMGW